MPQLRKQQIANEITLAGHRDHIAFRTRQQRAELFSLTKSGCLGQKKRDMRRKRTRRSGHPKRVNVTGILSEVPLVTKSTETSDEPATCPVVLGCRAFREELQLTPATREGLSQMYRLIQQRTNEFLLAHTAIQKKKANGNQRTEEEILYLISNDILPRGPFGHLGLQASLHSVRDPSVVSNVHDAEPVTEAASNAGVTGNHSTFEFVSIVGSYDAKCSIPLQDFHAKVRCADYDPTLFPSAVVTFPLSSCRVSVFANGKFIVSGTRTTRTALIAARNVLYLLEKCSYKPVACRNQFRLTNLTAVLDLGCQVNIKRFAEEYPKAAFLDNDSFPSVTYMPEKTVDTLHLGPVGLCLNIFATGKVVIIGGRNEPHLIEHLNEALKVLDQFLMKRIT